MPFYFLLESYDISFQFFFSSVFPPTNHDKLLPLSLTNRKRVDFFDSFVKLIAAADLRLRQSAGIFNLHTVPAYQSCWALDLLLDGLIAAPIAFHGLAFFGPPLSQWTQWAPDRRAWATWLWHALWLMDDPPFASHANSKRQLAPRTGVRFPLNGGTVRETFSPNNPKDTTAPSSY